MLLRADNVTVVVYGQSVYLLSHLLLSLVSEGAAQALPLREALVQMVQMYVLELRTTIALSLNSFFDLPDVRLSCLQCRRQQGSSAIWLVSWASATLFQNTSLCCSQ